MHYQPDKVYQGIILQKTIYRETSLICEILTNEAGKIKLLAKGIRKPGNPNYGLLQVLSEIEFSAYRNKTSEWHILKTAELKRTFENGHLQTTSVLQAGGELFSQLVIPENEAETYFRLLQNYLSYTQEIKKNAIALFWRLLIRIYKLNGISPDYDHCAICGKGMPEISGYNLQKKGFVCSGCNSPQREAMTINFSSEEQKLLKILPCIGNYLDDLEISALAAENLTQALLKHLNLHFSDHFHLKSLKCY